MIKLYITYYFTDSCDNPSYSTGYKHSIPHPGHIQIPDCIRSRSGNIPNVSTCLPLQ